MRLFGKGGGVETIVIQWQSRILTDEICMRVFFMQRDL